MWRSTIRAAAGSPTRCGACRRPACRCASSATTARTRPSTSPTRTATTSSWRGTAPSRTGRWATTGRCSRSSATSTWRTCSRADEADGVSPWVGGQAVLAGDAGRVQPREQLGEPVFREHHGPLAQADGAGRRGRHVRAAPDVEAEVMVVPAGGHEGGARHQGLDLEANDVAVEGEPALDVAHVQVKMPDHEAGVRVAARLLAGDEP